MDRLMNGMETWLRRGAYVAAAGGGAAMLLMLALIAANMALRPFGGTIRGTVEASGYLCALAVGLCLPAAQMAGSHIAAGLWHSSLPRSARLAQTLAGRLLCAALLFLVGRELFGIAEYAADLGEYIEGFGFSYYGAALGFAFGVALHAAMFLHAALRVLFPARPNPPSPEGRTQEGS
jgi:TRAP-type C4-dicarboxylate transport system permease small subunit